MPEAGAERPTDASAAGPDDALRRFVGSTCATGAVAVAASAALAADAPTVGGALIAVAALVLGDLPMVHVRHGQQNHSFTWSEAALVVGLVLLPAWWLPLLGPAAIVLAQSLLRRSAMKVAFNALSFATASAIATAVMLAVSAAIPTASEWAALAAATGAYFVVNWVSVAVAVARSRGVPVAEVARSGLLLGALFAMGNSSVAILIAIAAPREPLVLIAVPPVLVQLLFVYRNTREVISERDLWVAVQSVSEDLQRTSVEELPAVALAGVARLVDASAVELVLGDASPATRHRWVDGRPIECAVGTLARLADDVWGRAECERAPFWLDRATSPVRQRGWLQQVDVRTAIVVPVEWSTTMVGLLRVGFRATPSSMQRIESLLTTTATQVASAITSHRQTESLRHQAEHDDLTDLPNRNLLVQHLTRLLDRSDAERPRLAVLFFDLDGFKVVNDSLGHHVGDRLLLDAAQRLRSRMRPGDVVARFGGDEFIVVCTGLDGPTDAMDIAQRLLDALAEPARGGEAIPISASVGVAYADGCTDADTLLRDADAAMYQAKGVGPGSSCLFTAELRTQVLNRMHLEADLREAMKRDEIDVHYQPIVHLGTGRIQELEALARWDHPERGVVSPTSFISVAEESGHIRQLGELVLNRACADMRRWLDLGLATSEQRVAVNLSRLQLDATLPTVVGEALARHGLPASALTLEVTESAFVDDPEGVAGLERLRAIGVRVALDDFGTGYSSLSTLRDLPADVVKIDRSFVDRLGADAQLGALVKGIVELAHALDLEVIGEGVEGAQQAEVLAGYGCDFAQGWLHGRPASAALVEAMLAATPMPPTTSATGRGAAGLRLA